MNNIEKKFRDSYGNIGSIGSVITISTSELPGETYLVLDLSSSGFSVKRCFRGRKVLNFSWSCGYIHIVG